jgi:serine/threonine protein phosphatase PrpC
MEFSMSFLTFGISAQCKGKEHVNQDRFGAVTVKSPSGKEVLTAAVSDGVTMCFKGEVASYNTIRFVLNWGAEYFSQHDFEKSAIPEELDKLITKINRKLNSYAKKANKKSPKPGYSPYTCCTLSCAITDGEHILFFNIGDSVIYELKTYSTVEITSTKTHVNVSGRLTSYIGGIDDKKLDIRCIENIFDRSSAYLLCTDGMSNRIVFDIEANEDFRKFNQRLLSVSNKSNGITILEGMVEYVISQGETDDISALVIKSA